MQLGQRRQGTAESNTGFESRIDSLLHYASSWITSAGAQRMQNFYFFLAFQAALAAFLGAQYDKPGTGVVLVIVGCLGIISSIAFILLEIRNTELIMAGKNALDAIEGWLASRDSPSRQLGRVIDSMPQTFDRERACLRRAIWEFTGHKSEEFRGPVGRLPCYVIRHAFIY